MWRPSDRDRASRRVNGIRRWRNRLGRVRRNGRPCVRIEGVAPAPSGRSTRRSSIASSPWFSTGTRAVPPPSSASTLSVCGQPPSRSGVPSGGLGRPIANAGNPLPAGRRRQARPAGPVVQVRRGAVAEDPPAAPWDTRRAPRPVRGRGGDGGTAIMRSSHSLRCRRGRPPRGTPPAGWGARPPPRLLGVDGGGGGRGGDDDRGGEAGDTSGERRSSTGSLGRRVVRRWLIGRRRRPRCD